MRDLTKSGLEMKGGCGMRLVIVVDHLNPVSEVGKLLDTKYLSYPKK
jgi:hypothetical protein